MIGHSLQEPDDGLLLLLCHLGLALFIAGPPVCILFAASGYILLDVVWWLFPILHLGLPIITIIL